MQAMPSVSIGKYDSGFFVCKDKLTQELEKDPAKIKLPRCVLLFIIPGRLYMISDIICRRANNEHKISYGIFVSYLQAHIPFIHIRICMYSVILFFK